MFSQVSVCPQGGVLPHCMLGYTPSDRYTSWGGTLPWADTPWAGTPQGRHPQAGTPTWAHPPTGTPPGQVHPWACTPPRQVPSWADTPLGRHPLGRYTPAFSDTPASACWDTNTTPLHSACWDMVNKQAVHIPLECILVCYKDTYGSKGSYAAKLNKNSVIRPVSDTIYQHVPKEKIINKKHHSSRMRTICLPTVDASLATRC